MLIVKIHIGIKYVLTLFTLFDNSLSFNIYQIVIITVPIKYLIIHINSSLHKYIADKSSPSPI